MPAEPRSRCSWFCPLTIRDRAATVTRWQVVPTFAAPRDETWNMKVTDVETPVGIPAFEFESKPISRHRVATNSTAGAGPRPAPGADLIVTRKDAGPNRRSSLLTQHTFRACRGLAFALGQFKTAIVSLR